MIKNIRDNRYKRAVKQALNKRFMNKSVVNLHLAQIITDFSHQTVLKKGNFLLCGNLQFFVINKILSNHWIRGFFCSSELQFNNGLFHYIPKFWHRSHERKKKVFSPFSARPFVKVRHRSFFLHRKAYEPMSSLTEILQRLD